MGHVRVYTMSDTLARVQRMRGRTVLHPMGWDAFGLPAENAAIDRGIHPQEWTASNIAQMKTQMDSLGFAFDWDREVDTSSPDYYKWTQWLFLQMMKAGLAYRAEAKVNWDPVDGTVLANEQVDSCGRSWRSGAQVEQKTLKQWFLRISHYQDSLLAALNELPGWPSEVIAMQKSWIGRSQGADVLFPWPDGDALDVFTTRPDTLFGCSFLALAPEHPRLMEFTSSANRSSVQAYVSSIFGDRSKGDDSGCALGSSALHPLTGKLVPLFVASYVLPEYGTGAVMGVPAHDSRDHKFALRHSLPVQSVISASGILENSNEFDGMSSDAAAHAITQALSSRQLGKPQTRFRLRDWLVSRQRYWGAPIPVVHCDECGPVPVPEDQLPVELPRNAVFSGKGGSPLALLDEWVNTSCPRCGAHGRRDTDTLDTFVDSSWYFLRFAGPSCTSAFARQADQWLPVDVYVGGIEHAIMHLLYSRFVTRFLCDQGFLSAPEPFSTLLTQGMVLGETFHSADGRHIAQDSVERRDGSVFDRNGSPVAVTWEKMSKSKLNGVRPEDVIQHHGADTTRLFMLFKAPPQHSLDWDESGVAGQRRWLGRLWGLAGSHIASGERPVDHSMSQSLHRATQVAIKNVTHDIVDDCAFNTAIASLMTLSNVLWKAREHGMAGSKAFGEAIRALVLMLTPMAPHIGAELWAGLASVRSREWGPSPPQSTSCKGSDVFAESWPICVEVDREELATVVITVGGKKKGVISIPSEDAENCSRLEQSARDEVEKRGWMRGRKIGRVVVVQKHLVNFVPL